MTNKRKPTHRKHHRLHDYRSRCIYHITLVVSDRKGVCSCQECVVLNGYAEEICNER